MKSLSDYNTDELKLIYRLLQQQISEHMALMDSELLHDLQSQLQQQARENGIDVSLHSEWANWLNS